VKVLRQPIKAMFQVPKDHFAILTASSSGPSSFGMSKKLCDVEINEWMKRISLSGQAIGPSVASCCGER
jgi:hypothetical protein